MTWQRGQLRDGSQFTALVNDRGEVLGRYWHRNAGYVRESNQNNARPARNELAARIDVIAHHAAAIALEIKAKLAEPTEAVPQRTMSREGSEGGEGK